jgi:hypothetical protein
MIPQLKSIFNKNQWVQIQNWVNSKLTLKQDKFNASNTATGSTIVTINAKSGVATFTAGVERGANFTLFIISNSLITTSSIVRVGLSYAPNDTETCQISSYECNNGSISLFMTNFSGVDAQLPKVIDFQILN